MSDDLKAKLMRLDLTRVRPSEFDPIAVDLYKEGKLTEDVICKMLLFRHPGSRTLADDRPFNLLQSAEDVARVVRSLSPMNRAASQRQGYEATVYSAKGLATVIKALQVGKTLDARA